MRVRERRGKWVSRFQEMEIFTYPFSEYVFGTVVLFWLLASFVSAIVSMGLAVVAIPAGYATTFLYLQYSFMVIEHTSRGHAVIPKISADMVKPTKDSRLAGVFLLTTFFLSLIVTIHTYYPIIAYMFAIIVFPASLGVYVIHENLIAALNPVAWARTITRLEPDYRLFEFVLLQLVLIGFMFLTAITHVSATDLSLFSWFAHEFSLYVTVALSIVYFRFLGVILHANAKELEIPVLLSEEIEQEEEAEQARLKRSEFVMSVYREANANRSKKAWQMLTERMEEEAFHFETEYFDSVFSWDKPQLTVRMAEGYLERLLTAGNTRLALEVLEIALKAKPEFKLLSGDNVMVLADHADTEARRRICRELLGRFESDYPAHPRKGEALLVACRLSIVDLNDFDWARERFAHMKATYPEIRQHPKYESLSGILRSEG